MKLDQLYYFFNDMHTNKFCDDVVKTCLKRDDSQATVFGADDGKELLKSRNSNVVWIGEAWVMKVKSSAPPIFISIWSSVSAVRDVLPFKSSINSLPFKSISCAFVSAI